MRVDTYSHTINEAPVRPAGHLSAWPRLAYPRDVPIQNLFDTIPAPLPDEIAETLQTGSGVRIERIVSHGHASPEGFWYDQDQDEWVLLIAGSAGLRFDDETAEHALKPGDYLLIPAHCRHRVAWTAAGTDTIWLAVFFTDGTRG